jgi:hypothetical protein
MKHTGGIDCSSRSMADSFLGVLVSASRGIFVDYRVAPCQDNMVRIPTFWIFVTTNLSNRSAPRNPRDGILRRVIRIDYFTLRDALSQRIVR